MGEAELLRREEAATSIRQRNLMPVVALLTCGSLASAHGRRSREEGEGWVLTQIHSPC